jgi:arabinofuranosyltransferase
LIKILRIIFSSTRPITEFEKNNTNILMHDSGYMKKICLPIVIVIFISLILLLHINYLRFVCDDAFISFRYAKNFVEGNGLVYNLGEWVEGYTNFLWTVLLSFFMKIGLDVVVVSQVLGILFSLATIFLLLRLNSKLYPPENLFNFLAPLFLACCGAYAAWSTGGLETSFFTFLVFLGTFFFISGINRSKHFVFSGLTFALVCMTRLDGMIFVVITFLFLFYLSIFGKRISLKSFGLWILCFSLPFLIYFLWRWSYYGKFLPNTFYVKLGEDSSYAQGFAYLLAFIKRFWIWLMAIPLIFLGKTIKSNGNMKIIIPYFSSLISIFSLYVIYVGGDFMDMFRFFVPVLPFFFFLIQEGFRGMHYYTCSLEKGRRKHALVVSRILLIALGIFLFAYPSKQSNQVWSRQGIDSIGLLRESAHLWSKAGLMFKNISKPGESLATTAAGAIAYYSELYVIDELGLTLPSPSDLKARVTQRPGHSKKITDEFLLSLQPTYILGHPKIFDEYKQTRGVWGLSEIFLRNGYKAIVFPVKISDDETKYLYCLSLKTSPTE